MCVKIFLTLCQRLKDNFLTIFTLKTYFLKIFCALGLVRPQGQNQIFVLGQ